MPTIDTSWDYTLPAEHQDTAVTVDLSTDFCPHCVNTLRVRTSGNGWRVWCGNCGYQDERPEL